MILFLISKEDIFAHPTRAISTQTGLFKRRRRRAAAYGVQYRVGSFRDRDLNKQAKWAGKFNECRQQETSKGPTWLTGIHSSTPPFPVINRNSCGAVKPMTAVNANPPSLIG